MSTAGAQVMYYKVLASNDNSKNQIYLGPDFSALNMLPVSDIQATLAPRSKHHTFKAPLDFSWLDSSGALCPAPHAQLILYPEYPEVRMSGFLLGSAKAPSALMTTRTPGRVLFLGITGTRRILGYVAAPGDTIAAEIAAMRQPIGIGVFSEVPIGAGATAGARETIIAALRRIHLKGWIGSKRLRKDGSVVEYSSPNGGGYTLEAELGISPNSSAGPDFHGWEVKQHGVKSFDKLESGILTLMTPEPNGGFYRDAGPERFVRRFGYADRTGRVDRLNVGGVYRVGQTVNLTGLRLTLAGFDEAAGEITDARLGIHLLTPKGQIAAEWNYSELMLHWNRKHALAAYVPSQKTPAHPVKYRFGPRVRLGQQTDFLRLLRALAAGLAYYDPGIKLEGVSTSAPKVKRRSQFRIHSKDLSVLYERFETVDLLT